MAERIVRPDTAFSVSRQRRPRLVSSDHLAWIRTLPCLVSGSRIDVEAAHVRYASMGHGKAETGVGTKPSDFWVVPLSAQMHRLSDEAQHQHGEPAWWRAHNIDPLVVAALLYASSAHDEAGAAIVTAARRGWYPFPAGMRMEMMR